MTGYANGGYLTAADAEQLAADLRNSSGCLIPHHYALEAAEQIDASLARWERLISEHAWDAIGPYVKAKHPAFFRKDVRQPEEDQ